MQKRIAKLLSIISIFYGALVFVVLLVVKSKDSRAAVVGSVCITSRVVFMYKFPLSVMVSFLRFLFRVHCLVQTEKSVEIVENEILYMRFFAQMVFTLLSGNCPSPSQFR